MSFNLSDDPESGAHPAVAATRGPQGRGARHRQGDAGRTGARGYAEPGSTPIVPLYDYWHWEPPPEEAIGFDLAEANRLLDEAGYLDTDGDGVREVAGRTARRSNCRLFLASTDPDGFKAAPFIQGWLDEIGIDVSVRSMTDAKLYDNWYECSTGT